MTTKVHIMCLSDWCNVTLQCCIFSADIFTSPIAYNSAVVISHLKLIEKGNTYSFMVLVNQWPVFLSHGHRALSCQRVGGMGIRHCLANVWVAVSVNRIGPGPCTWKRNRMRIGTGNSSNTEEGKQSQGCSEWVVLWGGWGRPLDNHQKPPLNSVPHQCRVNVAYQPCCRERVKSVEHWTLKTDKKYWKEYFHHFQPGSLLHGSGLTERSRRRVCLYECVWRGREGV